jgi:hypothetical protein
MIHGMRREYFDLGLHACRLTFDDGLYSQYYYYPRLRELGTELVYFIATSLICPGPARGRFDGRHLPFVKSPAYMLAARARDDLSHFMTTEEVAFLSAQEGVRIGAHSHFHEVVLTPCLPKKPNSPWKRERLADHPAFLTRVLAIRSRLAFRGYAFRKGRLVRRTSAEWLDFVKYDTDSCLKWFDTHLGYQPTHYCLPFNEYNERLIEVLRQFGFEVFYNGRRGKPGSVIPRIDIDKLFEEHRQRHARSTDRHRTHST